MANSFDTAYPSVDDLRSKAKKRVPAFAFEYLVCDLCLEPLLCDLCRETCDVNLVMRVSFLCALCCFVAFVPFSFVFVVMIHALAFQHVEGHTA